MVYPAPERDVAIKALNAVAGQIIPATKNADRTAICALNTAAEIIQQRSEQNLDLSLGLDALDAAVTFAVSSVLARRHGIEARLELFKLLRPLGFDEEYGPQCPCDGALTAEPSSTRMTLRSAA